MEIKASAKYLRISPRKLRLLAGGLKGLSPEKALGNLELFPQKGKEFLIKLIKQAMANAVNNFKLVKENLLIKKIEISEGSRFKRTDKSHGARFDRGVIKKRTAHIFLTLETEDEVKKEKQISSAVNKKPEATKEARPPSPRLRRVNGTKS